ncbi:MAG: phosphotransferase, partial [Chloroflexi bacterium]|nr:phosphotransferase [Chloroflexota bacterium]
PRFLWSLDEGPGGWVALAFEAIDGRVPTMPWRDDELARVCQAINILGERLTPSPVDTGPERMLPAVFARVLLGWGKLAASASPEIDDWSRRNLERLVALEALAPQAVQGTSLVHMDTRADNVLLAGDRVYIVDWPHACVGASWVDFVGFAPSVAMQGGPAPEELLKRFPSAVAAVPDAVTAAVASIAGYFTLSALQRPPPGIPTVRDFQAAQGIAACRWLAARTGWR